MASTHHPTYPNPIIHEALCEIHFRLQEGDSWEPSWYSEFYRKVEEKFPIILPVTTPQIRFEISQYSTRMPVVLVPQIMRYQSDTGNVLLQLSEDRIVVNVLPDYPGWIDVREYIRYAWEQVCNVINPAVVVQVRLRYINRIERRGADETLGTWLTASDYIPRAVLASQPDVLSRIETQLNPDDRLSVTVSDYGITSESHGSFLLDIDHATMKDMTVDINLLLQEATRLHGTVWEVFRSAKGERLEQLLQGEIL